MKRVVLSFVLIIFVVGCGNDNKLKCKLGEDDIILTFSNGKIVEYQNGMGIEADNDVIVEMNTYLKEITDNNKAKLKMKEVILSFGGSCN